ncbi:hypothetical protein D9619_013017 [Psilocybe cf. subviscida]|uniref:Peptidase C14 caspase domain-containing protein n=1 Tax=Psilocybe cf. subviscida TaxID=2480587 RepID=A0A8H5AZG8_9AGAR|nr:hypothetical protein D9619_013017 [Psilocybe cf. subviscida]
MKILRYRFGNCLPGSTKQQRKPSPLVLESKPEVIASPTEPKPVEPLEKIEEEEDVTRPAPVVKTFKRKALLIGVQTVREDMGSPVRSPLSAKFAGLPGAKNIKAKWEKKKQVKLSALRGPHRDVKAMRELLIDMYSYKPEDIVTLIDDDDVNQKQPTRVNILEEINNLVKDADENDRFFFHFAGHSDQEDTDDPEEEDGKNEYILSSDGEQVKDDELRRLLAEPLPAGSSLIAVFDSCHSGSLLDLKHSRCNRVYVPWTNKGGRKTKTLWNQRKRFGAKISIRRPALANMNLNGPSLPWAKNSIDQVLQSPRDSLPQSPLAVDTCAQQRAKLSIITDLVSPRQTPLQWIDSPDRKHYSSPIAQYCTGFCRDNLHMYSHQQVLKADVISISSADDSQMSWEDPNGQSMTQSLVKILNETPHPRFDVLMTEISHNIHRYYVDLHSRARAYRKLVRRLNSQKIKQGKKPREGDRVEMNNFQEPQLSSDRPLDMSRVFYP